MVPFIYQHRTDLLLLVGEQAALKKFDKFHFCNDLLAMVCAKCGMDVSLYEDCP